MYLGLGIVARFGLGGRDIPDWFEQSAVVEPIHPFEGGKLDGFERPPRATPMDDLGLEQANHRLGERIIVGISNATDGGFDTCLGETLGVADADVLRPAVGVTDKTAAGERAALVQGLLQGIEHEVGPGGARHTPAYDPAREDVDHEGGVNEATPGRHVGEVRDPQSVRARGLELPVDPVERLLLTLRGSRGQNLAALEQIEARSPVALAHDEL